MARPAALEPRRRPRRPPARPSGTRRSLAPLPHTVTTRRRADRRRRRRARTARRPAARCRRAARARRRRAGGSPRRRRRPRAGGSSSSTDQLVGPQHPGQAAAARRRVQRLEPGRRRAAPVAPEPGEVAPQGRRLAGDGAAGVAPGGEVGEVAAQQQPVDGRRVVDAGPLGPLDEGGDVPPVGRHGVRRDTAVSDWTNSSRLPRHGCDGTASWPSASADAADPLEPAAHGARTSPAAPRARAAAARPTTSVQAAAGAERTRASRSPLVGSPRSVEQPRVHRRLIGRPHAVGRPCRLRPVDARPRATSTSVGVDDRRGAVEQELVRALGGRVARRARHGHHRDAAVDGLVDGEQRPAAWRATRPRRPPRPARPGCGCAAGSGRRPAACRAAPR